ncbi:MAG: hypothetical protein ABR543_18505 [Gemmatimonadaceae bacterium]
MTRRFIHAAFATVLVGTIAACSDSTSPASANDSQVTADVAVAVADGTAEDLYHIYSNEGVFGGAPMASVAADASAAGLSSDPSARWGWRDDCTFNSGTGRFECPETIRNGFTLNRSFALFDAAGTPQSAYDASLTASINFLSALAGTVSRPEFIATVERNRDLTVSGLAGREIRRTWNGTGDAGIHARHEDEDGSREYDLTSSTVIANVVVALPRADNPWPLAGTITRSVHGVRFRSGTTTMSREFDRTAVVTFNGTSIVPLDVGNRQFCLNLATGRLVRDVNCR